LLNVDQKANETPLITSTLDEGQLAV